MNPRLLKDTGHRGMVSWAQTLLIPCLDFSHHLAPIASLSRASEFTVPCKASTDGVVHVSQCQPLSFKALAVCLLVGEVGNGTWTEPRSWCPKKETTSWMICRGHSMCHSLPIAPASLGGIWDLLSGSVGCESISRFPRKVSG